MKKIFILFAVLILSNNVLNGCSYDYSDWQTIYLDGMGTFKVPNDWIVSEEDNMLCFTDKPLDSDEYKICLIQWDIATAHWDPKEDHEKIQNKFFDNVKFLDLNSVGDAYSNSASLYEKLFEIDGNEMKKWVFEFYYSDNQIIKIIRFVVWDDSINEDKNLLIKIAKSYRIDC